MKWRAGVACWAKRAGYAAEAGTARTGTDEGLKAFLNPATLEAWICALARYPLTQSSTVLSRIGADGQVLKTNIDSGWQTRVERGITSEEKCWVALQGTNDAALRT